MKNQFIPHNLALKLKELGFDDGVLAQYRCDGYLNWGNDSSPIGNDISDETYKNNIFSEFSCRAPLWQQVFDWFREKYNLHCVIDEYENPKSWGYLINNDDLDEAFNFRTYEEARLKCLEKLIELCTK